jgi:DUF1365 family protein
MNELKSCLYEGWVRHRRLAPVHNSFRYSLYMVYLDLGELDRVFRGRWLWSAHRFAPAWFRRKDHLGDPSRPLAEEVRSLVEQKTGKRPGGPIRLLTHLRYFGYCMNPVSFYYCFDPSEERRCIIPLGGRGIAIFSMNRSTKAERARCASDSTRRFTSRRLCP